ncbi:MAG: alpha/beta hydrolase [Gemmatimonadetes bacterium]|nr:alpha/beta hydrolase [Gemmatimonadota bacterium]
MPLIVAGRRISVSCMRREGAEPTVFLLPGLGMPATEALGVPIERVLPGRALLVPDFPGTGETPGVANLTVEHLADLAGDLARVLGKGRVVVVGHSMGGVAGLLLCRHEPSLVAGFVNVEGNLGPGDCFVSRHVVTEPLDEVADALAHSRGPGMARYAATLRRVRSRRTLLSLSRSLVEHCAGPPLLDWFTALSVPKTFVTGASSRGLPYLTDLVESGVAVLSIPRCGHFPMYSRPAAYYAAIDQFVKAVSANPH